MFPRVAPHVATKLGRVGRSATLPITHHRILNFPSTSLNVSMMRPRPTSLFSTSTTSTTEKVTPKLNKFRELWSKYGWVGVGTYLSVYVVTLGSMFVAIETGVLSTAAPTDKNGDDESFNIVTTTNSLKEWTESIGLGSHFNVPDVSPSTGSFLIAWVATKFTEPVRLAVTLMITPRIARYLKARKR